MRIDEIKTSAEYRMDEQFQNFPIFFVKFWFSKLRCGTTVNFEITKIKIKKDELFDHFIFELFLYFLETI